MSQDTPETALICRCVRETACDEPAALAEAAAMVRDWDELVEIAAGQRVAAYVHEAVSRCGLVLPPAALDHLRMSTLVARTRAMMIDCVLTDVATAFAAREIDSIVLKGPALARTIYPTAALRTYDDLDLLVQLQDEARAVDALMHCGYTEMPDEAEDAWHARAGDVAGAAAYHRRFFAPGLPALVELHTDPLQLGLAPACEDERWQRSQPLPGMSGLCMLGPEDQAVQLSVHAHKHGYSRLIWLKDLDLLLRAEQGRMNWPLVEAVARREGVSASVWYALRLAALLFDAPLPPTAERSLRPWLPIRTLYRYIWPIGDVLALSGAMHRRAVQFRPADAWRGSVPSFVLMGRRGDRARAGLSATARRLSPRPSHNR